MRGEQLAIMTVMIAIAIAVTTIFRLVLEHIRHARSERVQSEMYTRTLDKLGGSADVLSYLQSEAGSKLFKTMQDAPLRPAQPVNRIMTAVQIGVVLAVMGIGFLVLRALVTDPDSYEPLTVIGSLGIFAGLAMLASAGSSWLLAKRLGLMDGKGTQEF